MTAITISRQQAHDAGACVDDTRRVLNHLRERDGRIPRMDQRISIRDVADVLGVDGVVWCIGATRRHDALLRRFACLCARRALRRADVRTPEAWRAIRVAWWHAHQWADDTELAAAWSAARDVARDAARSAARDAAWAAERAAWDAAWGAAWAAARADARAARDAAWNAARDGAWAAAWDAAVVGARADAWDATGDAAWVAERDWQLAALLTMAGYSTPDGVADLTARSAA